MQAKYTYGFDLAPYKSGKHSTLVIMRDDVVMASFRGLEAETIAALIRYTEQHQTVGVLSGIRQARAIATATLLGMRASLPDSDAEEKSLLKSAHDTVVEEIGILIKETEGVK